MGTLLFLLTVLGLLVLAGAVLYALARRRFAQARRLGLIGGAWLGLYGGALLAVSLASAPVRLAPGQARCFDEMCFSVAQVAAGPAPGSPAAQRYYTVTIQLRNAARGTAQKPDSPAVRLVDQRGQTYAPTVAGQVTFIGLTGRRVAAGQAVAAPIPFAVPVDVEHPLLLVTEGGWPSPLVIGDENSPWHPQTLIPLDAGFNGGQAVRGVRPRGWRSRVQQGGKSTIYGWHAGGPADSL